jgi:type IV pilus assembly protein PilW
MMRENQKRLTDGGFSLTELLVAMAIAGIVMAAMYSTYASQQKSYLIQEEVGAMQQNLRAGMYYMGREIRMAGCDPTRSGIPGIITAERHTCHFTMDITDDLGSGYGDGDTGDAGEDISYSLSGTDLLRNGNVIAKDIQALDFVYLDASGTVLDGGPYGPGTDQISSIRSIQITLIARTSTEDRGYRNTIGYENQQNDLVFRVDTDLIDNDGDGVTDEPGEADGFRRKRLTTTIKCRNLWY